jgi:hypothetical protein
MSSDDVMICVTDVSGQSSRGPACEIATRFTLCDGRNVSREVYFVTALESNTYRPSVASKKKDRKIGRGSNVENFYSGKAGKFLV